MLTRQRPIFMTVAFNGKRIFISTGKKVDLQWWDEKKQRVHDSYSEAVVLNEWLGSLENTASVVWKSLASLSEKPGVDMFRVEFEKLRPRFSGGFFEVMIMFLEEGSSKWSKGTYQKVRTFYKQLKEFEINTGYSVGFQSINDEFLEKFRSYFQEKGRSNVTIRKQVNTLVWFLNWASEKQYNLYTGYRKFYRLLDEAEEHGERQLLYLEWEELMSIYRHKIEQTRKERVRDIFCLMSFTGLRFSEMQSLVKSDIQENVLMVGGASGKNTRAIPLNAYAIDVLSRYTNRYYKNNLALPSVSAATMNKYLRLLAKECKLNRVVASINDEGIFLSDAITAGVATQTFIIHAIRLGIPPEIISYYTGVKKDIRMELLKHELAKNEMQKFNALQNPANDV